MPSSLREQNHAAVRESILTAAVELTGEAPLDDVTMPEIAERAGVSLRTLYRHYSDRAALGAALGDWIAGRLVHAPLPRTADDVASTMEEVGPRFEESISLVRVLVRTRQGHDVRAPLREERLAAIDAALAHALRDVPDAERRRVTALVRHLASAAAWLELRDESDLDGEEAGQALAWAIRTLLAAAEPTTNDKELT